MLKHVKGLPYYQNKRNKVEHKIGHPHVYNNVTISRTIPSLFLSSTANFSEEKKAKDKTMYMSIK